MKQKIMHPVQLLLLFLFGLLFTEAAAQQCKEYRLKEYAKWNDIQQTKISDDGFYVVFEQNPQKGDGSLIIYDVKENKYDTIVRAYTPDFLPDKPIMVYRIAAPYDSLRKQKLAGIKADKLLKDSLAIQWIKKDSSIVFPQVKAHKISRKSGNLIAWIHEESYAPVNDTAVSDSTQKEKKPAVKKPKNAPKSYYLGAYNALENTLLLVSNVTDYTISDYDGALVLSKLSGKSLDSSLVYRYSNSLNDSSLVYEQAGEVKNLTLDENGRQLAFLATSDTSSRKMYALLYQKDPQSKLEQLADTTHAIMLGHSTLSPFFSPKFSKDGANLYFGVMPKPANRFKDTLTADEKTSLDLWHWKDGQLQTQQLKNLEKEQQKSFLATYDAQARKIIALGSEGIPNLRPDYETNPEFILAFNPLPYQMLSSWEQTSYQDVYLINRKNGSSQLLLKKHASLVTLSPKAQSVAYYATDDSSWYAIHLKNGKPVQLASSKMDVFYRSENDIPRAAGPIGFAGWRNEDELVVYGENSLWLLNVNRPQQSSSILNAGNDIEYRYIKLDEDDVYIPDMMTLSTFNTKTKSSGFGLFDFNEMRFKEAFHDDFRYTGLMRAKKASQYIYRKEDFRHYPDLYLTTDLSLEPSRLSDANPQLREYCQGSVQLVEWNSFNAEKLQGLLYHPANFSEDGKYPMLVYFYEKSSDGLHRHITPRPSRSVINISEYTNRGYFVFVPDINYRNGLPGQSAYDAIVSGTQSMLERFPQINKDKLGLQGQSWGGYQAAWLITRTNMFAAAMAGAPVANMTSAYGGIRWESGVVRAFQYEEGQSRIGANLWEDLPKYIENSPLFYADRIQTPLLIMANDADGAVPWYQGIELFNALRRLQKPVWMLNYNNAPHNLQRRADMEDLTMRMQQFFDHYLKGGPAPEWIKNGIPALDKGVTNGFQYE